MASTLKDRIREGATRNKELLALLSETDHAGPALDEQVRYISNLQSEIKDSKYNITILGRQRRKELKEHETYRDSVMRRFAYKATGKKEKFEERAAKEEREYFDVLQKEHQATAKQKQLEAMLADALKARDEFKLLASRHQQAQQDLDSLYESIFQGPTPGFPDEDDKEAESARALQVYHDARTKAEAEAQTLRILTDAQRLMRSAQGSMQEALSCSRADMFGGGRMADMMERNALTKAEQQVSAAGLLINQAKFMSPQVQPLPVVQIAQGSILSDVFFDNIFSDMSFHEKIKQSTKEVDACAEAVGWNLNAAKNRHSALATDMNQKAKILENARLALQKTREDAFRKINGS